MRKLIFLLVIVSGLTMTSCYQEPEKGIAKITTMYNGYRQSGVDVHLYGPPGSYIDLHRTSDLNGEVIYEHDPALEVILFAYCTYTDVNGLHWCSGNVRITPDKVEDYTFVLN